MNGTMKAVIFERPGQYAVVDKPIPKIRQSNEMLVRIDACSICGTDMQILKKSSWHRGSAGSNHRPRNGGNRSGSGGWSQELQSGRPGHR